MDRNQEGAICPKCEKAGKMFKLKFLYINLNEMVLKCESSSCMFPFKNFKYKNVTDGTIFSPDLSHRRKSKTLDNTRNPVLLDLKTGPIVDAVNDKKSVKAEYQVDAAITTATTSTPIPSTPTFDADIWEKNFNWLQDLMSNSKCNGTNESLVRNSEDTNGSLESKPTSAKWTLDTNIKDSIGSLESKSADADWILDCNINDSKGSLESKNANNINVSKGSLESKSTDPNWTLDCNINDSKGGLELKSTDANWTSDYKVNDTNEGLKREINYADWSLKYCNTYNANFGPDFKSKNTNYDRVPNSNDANDSLTIHTNDTNEIVTRYSIETNENLAQPIKFEITISLPISDSLKTENQPTSTRLHEKNTNPFTSNSESEIDLNMQQLSIDQNKQTQKQSTTATISKYLEMLKAKHKKTRGTKDKSIKKLKMETKKSCKLDVDKLQAVLPLVNGSSIRPLDILKKIQRL